MSAGRLFILDGHNILMTFEDLRHLQASDRGEEARGLLQDRIEEFATLRGKRVLLVFDGGGREAAGGGRHEHSRLRAGSLFEVVYSRGDGGADRLILEEARRRAEQGAAVTVVTDDIQTLAMALPRGVRHVGVREFWLAHVDPPPEEDEKPVAGRFADIEEALLALEPATPVPPRRAPGAAPESATATPRSQPLSGEALRQEELRRKRERGRRRHDRMRKRRTDS